MTASDVAQRVLIAAPTAKDAEITSNLLARAGIVSLVCESISALVDELSRGAGALLLTEDALTAHGIERLLAFLNQQPSWSELPIVMLMRGGGDSPVASTILLALRNVTLLERPATMRSVQSAVAVAVKSRLRQYQIRDQIDEITRTQQDRERLLESERAARTDAERANRLKDEFLATVSHELRTPLNAMLGWTQMLARAGGDPETMKEAIDVIERNARLQAQLIDDLLDMSRIISGKIRLDIQSIDLLAVLRAAIASIQPAADLKGVRILTHFPDTAGPIQGDAGRLQQVLWNLLSNSVKFTPQGNTVDVSLRILGTSGVEIRVADTGQGIDPPFLPYIFDRFRQADASITRKHGGLGLGLAIVKQLVELHGGLVAAESPGEGLGTTFIIRLPLVPHRQELPDQLPLPADRSSPCKREYADLQGLQVLVVDDDPDTRRLLKRVLTECHAKVITAASGPEALDILQTFTPNVLISDIGMPGMDGYEFIARVRAQGTDARRLPAAAVTAFARFEDKRHALHAGYQTHIAKPIEPAELIAVVANLGGAKSGPEDQPAATASHS